jgi:peptidoglycan/LPS O-acetylase OafA/YrhL
MIWVYKPREHPLSFYWRRVGRIWPAHLVALPLAIYAYYTKAHVAIDWPSLISSIFLVQTWSPHVTPTLPGNQVTWTLSVELLFYALFPLLARVAVRLRTRWLALITACGLVGMWAVDWFANTHYSPAHAAWVMRHPVVYLPEFLLGMTLALAIKRGWRLPLPPSLPVTLLVVYVYCHYQGQARFSSEAAAQLDYLVRPLVASLSALIILAFAQREIRGLRGVLNTKIMVQLGLWSYSFYLLHHSVSRLATYWWGRMPDNNGTLFALIGMGLVVNVLSWVLYSAVEEPVEKWWRRHTPKRWLRPDPKDGSTSDTRLPRPAQPHPVSESR